MPPAELGRLDWRRIAAPLGAATPVNRESGSWRGHRAIAGGRAAVRNVLYMATLSATAGSPPPHLYLRLRQRGRPAKAALFATMRKLLTILNAIVRDRSPWQTA